MVAPYSEVSRYRAHALQKGCTSGVLVCRRFPPSVAHWFIGNGKWLLPSGKVKPHNGNLFSTGGFANPVQEIPFPALDLRNPLQSLGATWYQNLSWCARRIVLSSNLSWINGLPVLSRIHSSVCLDCFVRVLDVESRTPGNQNVADGLQAGVQPHPIDTLESAIDLNFPSPE